MSKNANELFALGLLDPTIIFKMKSHSAVVQQTAQPNQIEEKRPVSVKTTSETIVQDQTVLAHDTPKSSKSVDISPRNTDIHVVAQKVKTKKNKQLYA